MHATQLSLEAGKRRFRLHFQHSSLMQPDGKHHKKGFGNPLLLNGLAAKGVLWLAIVNAHLTKCSGFNLPSIDIPKGPAVMPEMHNRASW